MKRLILRDKKGETIIEFAVILPLILLIIFGITEFGRALMVSNILTTASREGARVFIRSGGPGSGAASARVDTILVSARLRLSKRNITIDTTSLSQYVKLTVTYDFDVLSGKLLDFLGPRIWALKGTTLMRRE